MTKPNAKNERIKRDYVLYLEEAKRRDPATVDRVLKSIARFRGLDTAEGVQVLPP